MHFFYELLNYIISFKLNAFDDDAIKHIINILKHHLVRLYYTLN